MTKIFAATEPPPAGLVAPTSAPEVEIEITPQGKRQLLGLREIWQYRELLYLLTWRDVKVRYKQTLLGASWAILKPTLLMLVFTLFLGRMAQVPAREPYSLFVLAGLLPWILFSTGITSAANSVVGSEHLITKTYFPRIIIPIASVGPALVDFLVAIPLFLLLMIWYGELPIWEVVLVGIPLALLVLVTMGMGILLAALNVAYRDVRHVVPFLIQAWMFATPAIYMETGASAARIQDSAVTQNLGKSLESVAENELQRSDGRPSWSGLLLLNPLTGVIAFFRASTLGGPLPWGELACSAALIAVIYVVACYYFRRVEDSFADII